jgi:fumarate reductase subunit C
MMATETTTKPKELIRPMPANWWLQRTSYTLVIIRDFTSLFIAGYCIFLLVLMYRAAGSAESFRTFYESLASPLSFVLHLIVLPFAVYNSITFCHLAPRAMPVFRGEERVPDAVIVGAQYAIWILLSLILFFIALVA